MDVSSTDKKTWRNPIDNIKGLMARVDTSMFKSTFISKGKQLGIIKGFGVSDAGIETPQYVSNAIFVKDNAYMLFKEEGTPDINIKFVNGSNEVLNFKIPKGSVVPNIGAYAISDYKFENWYSDQGFKNKFDFSKPVYEDITIYGKYTKFDFNTSWYDKNKTSYDISTSQELRGLAHLANASNVTFEKKTINLKSNIDLKNEEWIPISNFKGEFNGNNHTISNLKIVDSASETNIGFFDTISGAKINNLKFNNVNICSYIAQNVGTVAGLSSNSNLEKVSVTNINVKGIKNIGAIVGCAKGGSITETASDKGKVIVPEKGMSLETTPSTIGGIVGKVEGNISLTNLYAGIDVEGKGDSGTHCGGIIGAYVNSNNSLTMKNVLYTGRVDPAGFDSSAKGGIYCSIGSQLSGNDSKDNNYNKDKDNNQKTWLFDFKTSGLKNSSSAKKKGTSKTTDELKKAKAYDGWDKNIWNIQDGKYATLKWLK